MSEQYKVGVVDRIEGNIAIIMSDKREIIVSVKELPPFIKEGDVIDLETYRTLSLDKKRRRESIAELIEDIFK